MNLDKMKCTENTVIFKTPPEVTERKSGSLYLTRDLNRDTHWVECAKTGPDSILQPGDELLVSKRITSCKFEIDGEKLENTSDNAVLGFRRDGKLGGTCGTILYEWIEEIEEVTASGIVVIRKDSNKETDVTRKAKVYAAGPKAGGIKAGDIILLNFNKDAYKMENIIEGKILHNCGVESIICFWSSDESN